MTLEESKKIKLSEHFTLYEAIYSHTAEVNRIDNMPDKRIINNLTQLCKQVLEPIRQQYNKPIIISSGYRNAILNAMVGGASGSQHVQGTAMDIKTKDINDMQLLWNMIKDMLDKGSIECRQLINEHNLSWIHISINDKYHSYRKNQIVYVR